MPRPDTTRRRLSADPAAPGAATSATDRPPCAGLVRPEGALRPRSSKDRQRRGHPLLDRRGRAGGGYVARGGRRGPQCSACGGRQPVGDRARRPVGGPGRRGGASGAPRGPADAAVRETAAAAARQGRDGGSGCRRLAEHPLSAGGGRSEAGRGHPSTGAAHTSGPRGESVGVRVAAATSSLTWRRLHHWQDVYHARGSCGTPMPRAGSARGLRAHRGGGADRLLDRGGGQRRRPVGSTGGGGLHRRARRAADAGRRGVAGGAGDIGAVAKGAGLNHPAQRRASPTDWLPRLRPARHGRLSPALAHRSPSRIGADPAAGGSWCAARGGRAAAPAPPVSGERPEHLRRSDEDARAASAPRRRTRRLPGDGPVRLGSVRRSRPSTGVSIDPPTADPRPGFR
jgi:hypothetical protein